MRRWIAPGFLSLLFLFSPLAAQAFYDEYYDFYHYGGGGLHFWNADEASALGIKLRAGRQLGSFIGAEVQLAALGEDAETRLKHLFGLYATFSLPLDGLRPYAKLGLNHASMEVAAATTTAFELGYGMGVAFDIRRDWFVDLEYMMYLDTPEMELNGFTLGVGYRF